MTYVQRNELGKIIGAFANLQEGFAEELVEDDSLELLEFYNPPELILHEANFKRDSLLTTAALRIAPLQDAVDIGVDTDIDIVKLSLWKQYRVDVNRVSDQADFPFQINWPVQPD